MSAPPRLDRRGSWVDTRRELARIAWAVLLIDVIAIGLGALADRAMGGDVFFLGLVLAGVVTLVFTLIIVGNLAIEYAMHRWMTRRARSGRSDK
jgi:hypothetical protein